MSRPDPRLVRRARRLPARVYWFRRVLLLCLLLLLGWAGVRLAGSGSDDADQGAALDPSTVAAQDPGAGPGAAPGDGPGPDGGEAAGLHDGRQVGRTRTVTTALDDTSSTCRLGSVHVRPTVTETAVVGRPVRLRLALATTAAAPCRFDPSPQSLLVRVADAERTTVWDSSQCPSTIAGSAVVLRPGWQSALDVTWSGRRGDRSCSTGTGDPAPGTYAVQAAVVGGEPARSTFVLAAPGAPAGQT